MEEQLQFKFEELEQEVKDEEVQQAEPVTISSILEVLEEPSEEETGTIVVELDGTVRIEKDNK